MTNAFSEALVRPADPILEFNEEVLTFALKQPVILDLPVHFRNIYMTGVILDTFTGEIKATDEMQYKILIHCMLGHIYVVHGNYVFDEFGKRKSWVVNQKLFSPEIAAPSITGVSSQTKYGKEFDDMMVDLEKWLRITPEVFEIILKRFEPTLTL